MRSSNRFKVKGQEKLIKQLQRLDRETQKEVTDAVQYAGKRLAQEIGRAAPRKTGRMARAVRHVSARGGMVSWVGYRKLAPSFRDAWRRGGFVALFQEFGTRNMPAQPFVRPTYRKQLPWILTLVDRAVKRARNKATSI